VRSNHDIGAELAAGISRTPTTEAYRHLSAGDRRLLVYLINLARAGAQGRPLHLVDLRCGHAHLAEKLVCTDRTIRRQLAALDAAGFVFRAQRRGQGQTDVLRLHQHAQEIQTVVQAADRREKARPTGPLIEIADAGQIEDSRPDILTGQDRTAGPLPIGSRIRSRPDKTSAPVRSSLEFSQPVAALAAPPPDHRSNLRTADSQDADREIELKALGADDPATALARLLTLIEGHEERLGCRPDGVRVRQLFDAALHHRKVRGPRIRDRIGALFAGISSGYILELRMSALTTAKLELPTPPQVPDETPAVEAPLDSDLDASDRTERAQSARRRAIAQAYLASNGDEQYRFDRMAADRGGALPEEFPLTANPELDQGLRELYIAKVITRSMSSGRTSALAPIAQAM
jgi:hypothetical protein